MVATAYPEVLCSGKRYLSILALMTSCASPGRLPPPSLLHSEVGLCSLVHPLLVVRTFPTLSAANPSLDAWSPTPAGLVVRLPVSSHQSSAFPTLGTGRLSLLLSVQRLLHSALFRGCRHFFMFRPPSLLATQVAPTDPPQADGSRGFLLPSNVRIVTSPYVGYASRLNRVIDGRGLPPLQIRSLVGCSPNVQASAARQEIYRPKRIAVVRRLHADC